MAKSLACVDSPALYFKEHVELAMQHQQLEASEQTEFYVVNMLVDRTRHDRVAENLNEAFAVQLVKALQSGYIQQRHELRLVGDLSLFFSGFFSDSLKRSLVDVDYYVSLGVYAYGVLSQTRGNPLIEVYAELAEKFAGFVDVLEEVGERCMLTSDKDLLRLYEKWVRTRSRRVGQLLLAHGLLPNASIRSRLQ